MSGLKAWKEYPGWVSTGYKGASISAEVSPELLGVGYIIGPRIAGYLFAGGSLAYLVLHPGHQAVRQRPHTSRSSPRPSSSPT